MRITIARLRRGIAVLACLLVAAILGFFVYAHHRIRGFEKDLPGRLGINIQQTANGYTYSQSSKGHTLYTIHASKLIQYKTGGHARLHDVSITLYGPEGSNRTDKISGSDFDYDAKNQIVSAMGTVVIDLQGLGSANKNAPPPQPIHIKTSGLVFNQKTGEADTTQYTEFAFPKASGSSMGTHYNSKTGVLVLDSQVQMTTDGSNGSPAVVHATHAQIVRDSKQAFLLNPQTDYQSEKGSADQAIVSFRQDGSAQSINAQGHVRIVTSDGAVITASNSQTQLDAQGQPVQADLGGGVNFASTDETQSMHGTADSGTLTFGKRSLLQHAQFRNDVSFVDQVFKLSNDPNGTSSRQMQAMKIDVDFAPGPDGKKAVAQKALATGNAVVHLHTIPSKGPQQVTTINGDQLLALLTGDGTAIRQLDGAGHTKIVDLGKNGATNTSSGDRLHVVFDTATAKKGAKASDSNQASQIETAVQDGNVVMTQLPVKKPGATAAPVESTAWAQHAEYHASDQILRLTGGNPHLTDGQSLQMAAQEIDYHRDSGDTDVAGSVKATYTRQKQAAANAGPQLGGSGPVHITANRAQISNSGSTSVFYGSTSTLARMWQDANSVLAPVIELNKNPETLKAHGEDGNPSAVVNANFTSALGAKHQQSTVRIHSQTLVYTDADRRADFHGSVIAEDPDGVIHSDQAQVFLTPAPKGAASQGQTQIDHIVATGHIVLTQPGRKGVGEKLVYTADDGKYVLTGTTGNPPHIYDAARGTTTGTTLIFNSQDDSVVVSGGQSSAVTETRTPK